MTTAVIDQPTDRDDPIDAARALAPILRARAADAQALRTMPPDLVRDVKAAGLFRLALPAALGGREADALTIFNVIEQLSHADGSAGWTVLIGNSTAFLAWLEPDVARDLLEGDPDRSSTGEDDVGEEYWAEIRRDLTAGTSESPLTEWFPA